MDAPVLYQPIHVQFRGQGRHTHYWEVELSDLAKDICLYPQTPGIAFPSEMCPSGWVQETVILLSLIETVLDWLSQKYLFYGRTVVLLAM